MEIFNRRIRIRAFCMPISLGFYEAEKKSPQRVLIDVELRLAPLQHDIPDDVRATVDYDLMHRTIPKLVAGRHFNLQETLCHEILSVCIKLDGVIGARVWVRKPDICADCKSAGYEAEVSVNI
ncbi:dihydroneopterin aldolase [Thiobacillus sedimenti]|uniref:dihydroneopterin aldolase n=1 Tax=Thiobacillus sedimenti TaxID=3110231 RepID=A0ABZ1CNC0_9PROT|nr:dihydroneopterin aldolase [Thiobacillus sp. SCUT-2]WRS40535.1 dihydroneopterin aldolase [Thiobacillus sp. SCUT-2]